MLLSRKPVYLDVMEMDFGKPWHIVSRTTDLGSGDKTLPDPEGAVSCIQFAAAELAAVIGRISGTRPGFGSGAEGENLMVLDCEESPRTASAPVRRSPGRFSWRSSSERVELWAEDPPALVAAVYDFLGSLGVSWPFPGESGERLPSSPRLIPNRDSGYREGGRTSANLILGHAVYFEKAEEYLQWAARNSYSSLFFYVSRAQASLVAGPLNLYDKLRGVIAASAARRGVEIELGGHILPSFLPRNLFAVEPQLFREEGGRRRPDGNFCTASKRSLELAASNFSGFVAAHPEVSVFHVWPEDSSAAGSCTCPDCASLDPGSQSIRAAVALAESAPQVRLSYLTCRDHEPGMALKDGRLPRNLELIFAPRNRSRAKGIGDRGSSLNAGQLSRFQSLAATWKKEGGGAATIFEYWEDGFLYKGAVPPLSATLAADLESYTSAGASAIGIFLAGSRLPLSPRPNPWLFPRILATANTIPEAKEVPFFAEWIMAVFGPLFETMASYWKSLEAAWAVDLDVEEDDTVVFRPSTLGGAVDEPIVDWGDPSLAPLSRLAFRRGRTEELFDHLRAAESALAEAGALAVEPRWKEALASETAEYRIACAILELNCARLSACHEAASGEARAAADIALVATSLLDSFGKSLVAIPDPRSRRELAFISFLFFEMRFKLLRRIASGNPLRRALDRLGCYLRLKLGLATLGSAREY